MSRQDRLAADLDRGFTALAEGRLDEAAACVERCERIDRRVPDVVMLAAGIADARGDAEQALAMYRRLVEVAPDEPTGYICVARLELYDLGDPDAALDTIEAAFDYIDEEVDLVAAVAVRTGALLAVDDLEGARNSIRELSTSVIDDAELALDLAELALGAGDPSLAAQWIEIARKEPALEADALHLLGRAHEATGDRAQMIAAWQQVRELDAKGPPGAVSISEDELEKIALAALAELPDNVRARLANVPILIDGVPSAALVADGIDPRVLGLFQGTPLPEGGELAGTVTNILLFRTNLEHAATDLDQLAEEVRITVLHETAHYFGLDEDDLARIGLD